jgi:hypothetical protein
MFFFTIILYDDVVNLNSKKGQRMLKYVLDQEYSMDKSYKPKIYKSICIIKQLVKLMLELERLKKKSLINENKEINKIEEPTKEELMGFELLRKKKELKKIEELKIKEEMDKFTKRLSIIYEEPSFNNQNDDSSNNLNREKDEPKTINNIEEGNLIEIKNIIPNAELKKKTSKFKFWENLKRRKSGLNDDDPYPKTFDSFREFIKRQPEEEQINQQENEIEKKEKELIIENNESLFYPNSKKNNPDIKYKKIIFINKREPIKMRNNKKNIECFSIRIVNPIVYINYKTIILTNIKFILFFVFSFYIYIYLMVFVNSIHKNFGDKTIKMCFMPVMTILLFNFLINMSINILITTILLKFWGKLRLFNSRFHFLKRLLFDILVPPQALELYSGILIYQSIFVKSKTKKFL